MRRGEGGGAQRARVGVSAIVHATESEERVLGALAGMLGVDAGAAGRQAAQGHFGNRIVTVSASVTGAGAAVALRAVGDALAWPSREAAFADVRRRIRGGAITVRLDKQGLVRGRAELGGVPGGGGDVVVEVGVRVARGEDAAGAIAEALLRQAGSRAEAARAHL